MASVRPKGSATASQKRRAAEVFTDNFMDRESDLLDRMNRIAEQRRICNLIDGGHCEFRTGDRVQVSVDVGKGLYNKVGYVMGTRMSGYHCVVLFDDDSAEAIHVSALKKVDESKGCK